MGAGNSGLYNNNKGSKSTLSNRISSLPKNPNNLTKQGWKETTPPSMASKTSRNDPRTSGEHSVAEFVGLCLS